MNFLIEGHGCVNAVQQMLICIFPEEEHKQVFAREELGERYVISRLLQAGEAFVFEAEAANGNSFTLPVKAGELDAGRTGPAFVRKSVYRLLIEGMPNKPEWGMVTGVSPSKLGMKGFSDGHTVETVQKQLEDEFEMSRRSARLAAETGKLAFECTQQVHKEDVELYIGIPFCPSKCAYCSFVSNDISGWGHLIEPYLEALFKEIEITGRAVKTAKRRVGSVYIGGGTPTTLTAEQLYTLLEKLHGSFELEDGIEFTLEAGRPETINEEKLYIAASAGVSRISINPQSMNIDVLKRVGRLHTPQDIVDCYRMARKCGDFTINMDLIAGLPGDCHDGLLHSVRQVAGLEPEDITLHCLALKKGAPLRFGAAGRLDAGTIEACHSHLRQSGYSPYYMYRQKYIAGNLENVGFTRSGGGSRYNIVMINELSDVIAVGAGGSSKISAAKSKINRAANPKYPADYILRMADTGRCEERIFEALSAEKGQI